MTDYIAKLREAEARTWQETWRKLVDVAEAAREFRETCVHADEGVDYRLSKALSALERAVEDKGGNHDCVSR